MRKFKKGDKIYRPKNPELIVQVDDIQDIHQHYVCTSSEGERIFVAFISEDLWEVVKPTEHKFKVGDKVAFIHDTHKVHVITEVNEKDGEYYLDGGHSNVMIFENEEYWELFDENCLSSRYETLANDYLTEFIKQTGIEEDAPFWVGGEVAGIACVGDYFVDYATIRYVVDGKIMFVDFDDWYCYCNEVHMVDDSFKTPTLEQWLDNEFVRIPHERLEEMKLLKKQFEDMVEEEKSKQ